MLKKVVRASSVERVGKAKFTDETQNVVSYLFARNKSPQEIANELHLDPTEIRIRYRQCLREYLHAAEHMNEEWARIEILKLLRMSNERREEARRRYDLSIANQPDQFPDEELRAQRDEDKITYKILRDFLDDGLKQKRLEEKEQKKMKGYPTSPDATGLRGEVKAAFEQKLVQYKQDRSNDPDMPPSLMEDLMTASGGAQGYRTLIEPDDD